jgi:hypothetical protein
MTKAIENVINEYKKERFWTERRLKDFQDSYRLEDNKESIVAGQLTENMNRLQGKIESLNLLIVQLEKDLLIKQTEHNEAVKPNIFLKHGDFNMVINGLRRLIREVKMDEDSLYDYKKLFEDLTVQYENTRR